MNYRMLEAILIINRYINIRSIPNAYRYRNINAKAWLQHIILLLTANALSYCANRKTLDTAITVHNTGICYVVPYCMHVIRLSCLVMP